MPEKSHAIGFTFIHSHESYWVLVLEHTGIADTCGERDEQLKGSSMKFQGCMSCIMPHILT